VTGAWKRAATAAMIAVAAVSGIGMTGVAPASAGSTPSSAGINATADAYVSGASPSSNFGTMSTLIANASGPVFTHLQFSVTASDGMSSATLQVYSTVSGSTRTQVYSEPSTWTETGITYATQPTRGASLGSLSALTAGSYSTLTVPLHGDGTYSFVLATTATTARTMTSRRRRLLPNWCPTP